MEAAQRKKGGKERGRQSLLPGAITDLANAVPSCLLRVTHLLIHKQRRARPEPTYPQNGRGEAATFSMFLKMAGEAELPRKMSPAAALVPHL